MSTLFDVELDEDSDASTEAEVDDSIDSERPVEWVYDMMPLEVLLVRLESRTALIRYAVNAVDNDSENVDTYRNKSSLGDAADTTRHAVHRHIDTLVELGIFLQKGDSRERYAPNPDSAVINALIACNDDIGERMLDSYSVLDLPADA